MSLNAAAIEFLLGKGLTGGDLLEVARALEGGRSAAAIRQARFREKRNVTRNVTPPLKENSKPTSVSDETGGKPPDPLKELFDLGVSVLAASCKTEKEARSLVGMWRKDFGDGETLAALTDARTKAISNPIEWVPKRLKQRRPAEPADFLAHYREQQRTAAGASP